MKYLYTLIILVLGTTMISCGPSRSQIRAERVEALKKTHELVIIKKLDVIDAGGNMLNNSAGIIIKMNNDTIHVESIRVVTGWTNHVGIYMPKDDE